MELREHEAKMEPMGQQAEVEPRARRPATTKETLGWAGPEVTKRFEAGRDQQ